MNVRERQRERERERERSLHTHTCHTHLLFYSSPSVRSLFFFLSSLVMEVLTDFFFPALPRNTAQQFPTIADTISGVN
jgi:hypothetical protein